MKSKEKDQEIRTKKLEKSRSKVSGLEHSLNLKRFYADALEKSSQNEVNNKLIVEIKIMKCTIKEKEIEIDRGKLHALNLEYYHEIFSNQQIKKET